VQYVLIRDTECLAEALHGLYQAEVIHRPSWKSLEAVEWATLAWGTGSISVGCWNPLAIFRPLRLKPPISVA
jgi:hypothetical protein